MPLKPLLLLGVCLPALFQGVREVRLTTPARTLGHEFTQIRGVRELADGRILVIDRLEPALYVADLTRNTLQKVGRQGPGPSEYTIPVALVPYPGDSTILTDEGNARLSIIGPDLKFHRSVSTQQPGLVAGLYPRGVDPRGRLYFQIPRWSMGMGRQPDDSLWYARIELRTGKVDTLGKVLGISDPPGKIRKGLPYIPFSPVDIWQINAEGRIAIVRAKDYHIDWREPDGRWTRGPAVPFTALPVTDRDRLDYTRNFLENSSVGGRGGSNTTPSGLTAMDAEWLKPERVRKLADDNAFAERKPPFTDLLPRFGPEGNLWVERSVAAGAPRSFDVFDPTGKPVLRVVLPAGRRLLTVGRKGLYLVAVGEDGTESLELHPSP